MSSAVISPVVIRTFVSLLQRSEDGLRPPLNRNVFGYLTTFIAPSLSLPCSLPHWDLYQGCPPDLQNLLKYINVKDGYGYTPLMLAIRFENSQPSLAIDHLLSQPNLDLTLRERRGLDALDYAIMRGDLDLVQRILNKNPSLLYTTDLKGRTRLMMAYHFDRSEIANYIITQAKDISVIVPTGFRESILGSYFGRQRYERPNESHTADLTIIEQQSCLELFLNLNIHHPIKFFMFNMRILLRYYFAISNKAVVDFMVDPKHNGKSLQEVFDNIGFSTLSKREKQICLIYLLAVGMFDFLKQEADLKYFVDMAHDAGVLEISIEHYINPGRLSYDRNNIVLYAIRKFESQPTMPKSGKSLFQYCMEFEGKVKIISVIRALQKKGWLDLHVLDCVKKNAVQLVLTSHAAFPDWKKPHAQNEYKAERQEVREILAGLSDREFEQHLPNLLERANRVVNLDGSQKIQELLLERALNCSLSWDTRRQAINLVTDPSLKLNLLLGRNHSERIVASSTSAAVLGAGASASLIFACQPLFELISSVNHPALSATLIALAITMSAVTAGAATFAVHHRLTKPKASEVCDRIAGAGASLA